MRLFAATYLVPISVSGTGVRHLKWSCTQPALASSHDASCPGLQFQFHLQQSLKTKRGANFHFHSALPPSHALTRTDLIPRTISRQHRQSVTQSVVPCRALVVSCPRPWKTSWTSQPAYPIPSHLPLFSSPTPYRRPGSQPPLLSTQPVSQPARFLLLSPGTFPSPICLPDLPGLPAPSPSPWNLENPCT